MSGQRPSRLERVRSWMDAERLDCTIVTGAVGVNHLLGYWRYFGGLAAAVVDPEECTLVVPDFEEDGAREAERVDRVVTYPAGGFGLVPDQAPLLVDALIALPRIRAAGRVGLSTQAAGVEGLLRERSALMLVDAEEELGRIRLIKDADELERIGRAYGLAWLAQETVRRHARAGCSEIELFTAGQGAAQLAAGEPIEYMGDMLGGVRSADVCAPVRVAGREPLHTGDALVSDIVVGARGYWGDTAETVAVGEAGDVADVRAGLVEIVERCGRMLEPGRAACDVFAGISGQIAEGFPGGEFPHHGGHGVGLGSYDDPHVVPTDPTPLEEGMVIALEPGVYFPGRFGARVERMYVVTPGGGVDLRAAADELQPRRET